MNQGKVLLYFVWKLFTVSKYHVPQGSVHAVESSVHTCYQATSEPRFQGDSTFMYEQVSD